MAYVMTDWSKGDIVTSAKLNKIETELQRLDARVPDAGSTRGGFVLTTVKNGTPAKWAEWRALPNPKFMFEISEEEATQIYALVDQLKTAADSATTKMAATGVPFDGTTFLTNLVNSMLPEEAVPVIKIVSSEIMKHKYLSVNDATASYASFGYTETSATTLYEVRFFVNATSIIVRVTSCPYTIVEA